VHGAHFLFQVSRAYNSKRNFALGGKYHEGICDCGDSDGVRRGYGAGVMPARHSL